jgi:hypothetical protein
MGAAGPCDTLLLLEHLLNTHYSRQFKSSPQPHSGISDKIYTRHTKYRIHTGQSPVDNILPSTHKGTHHSECTETPKPTLTPAQTSTSTAQDSNTVQWHCRHVADNMLLQHTLNQATANSTGLGWSLLLCYCSMPCHARRLVLLNQHGTLSHTSEQLSHDHNT